MFKKFVLSPSPANFIKPERITEVIVSGMEAYFHILSLIVKPVNLGLTLLVLMLSEIERWLTNGTVASIS
ncbi:hypothetical protein GWK47_006138 [Chionoecetes opilio]|uniref:Uncharacterized protein n=1 Tax=Chionoecetes opilio TaxID=41210 RepID=A0A8J4YFR2_CHIOP|nr:hypothetical protein GWK47_006138 [Chionoecetes opilio]